MTPPRFDAAALGRTYDVAAVREQRARTRALLGSVDGTVLDLGCGPGHLSAELAASAHVVAVDREAAMLTATRARAGAAVLCLRGEATALAEAWRADLRGQADPGSWWFGLTRTATVVTRG